MKRLVKSSLWCNCNDPSVVVCLMFGKGLHISNDPKFFYCRDGTAASRMNDCLSMTHDPS